MPWKIFTLAKQELQSEAMAALGLPTRREMDDLYREIYLLKKSVKGLAQKNRPERPRPGRYLMDRGKVRLT